MKEPATHLPLFDFDPKSLSQASRHNRTLGHYAIM